MVSPLIFLRELPSGETLRKLLPQYAGDEIEALECYLLLLRAVNDMIQPVEALLAEKRLSRGRLSVLLRLLREHPHAVAASTLAHDCGVRQATMTGLLQGLVNAGLVRRQIDRHDKRVSLVNLTPQGIRVMDQLLPRYFLQLERLSAGMSQKQRTALIKLLREFIQSVSHAGERNAGTGPKGIKAANHHTDGTKLIGRSGE